MTKLTNFKMFMLVNESKNVGSLPTQGVTVDQMAVARHVILLTSLKSAHRYPGRHLIIAAFRYVEGEGGEPYANCC